MRDPGDTLSIRTVDASHAPLVRALMLTGFAQLEHLDPPSSAFWESDDDVAAGQAGPGGGGVVGHLVNQQLAGRVGDDGDPQVARLAGRDRAGLADAGGDGLVDGAVLGQVDPVLLGLVGPKGRPAQQEGKSECAAVQRTWHRGISETRWNEFERGLSG